MRPIGSKIELIALKMPLFLSDKTLFETLNLSISVLKSQVILSVLFVGNSSRSKFTTLDEKNLRDRFFEIMRLFDINLAKLKQPYVSKRAV